MTCLGCNLIEVRPVALDDGRTVCATCPDVGVGKTSEVLERIAARRDAVKRGATAERLRNVPRGRTWGDE